ncbi:MAG: adenylate/guanylate cyclase domain-containing protein [Actinomycetota bacterium]
MTNARNTGLRAVLFTDIVNSTDLAREMGDVRWSRLLGAQRRVIRALLKSHGGHEVDTAGDGFFAVFDRPTDAVRCGFECSREVQDLGIDIRGGVHVGEVELAGSEVHGIVVHTGARIMGQAGAAEVVVTATVKDLVAGARFEMQERGTVQLKGVPGSWTLFDVMAVDDRLRPAPIEGATVASERRDRATSMPVRTGRRRWLAPAAAVVVFLVAAGAVVATRSDPTFIPSAGTVAEITSDGTFAEPVQLATIPTAIAWGAGRVWVTDQQGQIHWLDPSSGDHGARGAAGTPTGVSVGGDAVWVTNGFGVGAGTMGGVSRVGTDGDALDPAFETPSGTEAIGWSADRVWVTDTATAEVRTYDPVTRSIETIQLPAVSATEPARPEHLAPGSGDEATVWVGDAAENRVFRLTLPNRVDPFPVPSRVTGIAVGNGGVWVTGGDDDIVTLLDERTGAALTSLEVADDGCNQPEAVAVGAGSVWVACRASGTVIRIDTETPSVTGTLAVEGAPTALASGGDGAVWLAVGPE